MAETKTTETKTISKEELLADLDIQLKQLQVEAARAALQDTRESLDERQLKRDGRAGVQRDRAKQLRDEEEQRRLRIVSCPHKKGGMDLAGWKEGVDNNKHSVRKHQFPNGDYASNCTRCNNHVIMPVQPLKVDSLDEMYEIYAPYGYKRADFTARTGFFAKDDSKGFAAAMRLYRKSVEEYNDWLRLPTDNVASTSCLPGQTSGAADWKRLYRLAMHENLGIPIFMAQKYPPKPREKRDEAA